MRLPASYKGLWNALSRYWGDYGGWSDFLLSPLLHLSLIISAASYAAWAKPDWVDLPLSLLPNLLGFSLGAYALIFSLADERLLVVLNAPNANGGPTNLRMINATFLHFILVQTAAIIFAIMNKSSLFIDLAALLPLDDYQIGIIQVGLAGSAGLMGYFLTVYAVALLIGAALAAYRLAIMSGRAASLAQQQRQPATTSPSVQHEQDN